MKLTELNDLSQMPLKTIHVCGDSAERGYQYGSQAKDLIQTAIQTYQGVIRSLRGEELAFEEMLEEARAFLPAIKRYDREYFKEMKGIAEGSGASLEEIVFLNVRSELMNPAWSKKLNPEGCTSFLLQPERTRSGECLMGQTYDWFPACAGLLLLLHSEDEQGHEFLTVTEAGILGKIGCNNRGVGVLLNYLNNFEINRAGAPYNLLLRRALDSSGFYEAQRNLMRSPIAFGLNLFLADRAGNAADYELTAKGMDFFLPENGLLVHTNHHISEKLSLRTYNKEMYLSSESRYDTAKAWLGRGNPDIKDLMELVSFHDTKDSRNNICRHEQEDEYGMESIFTMILNLSAMEFYLCLNPPCSSEFYRISLQKVFRTYSNRKE